MRICKEPLPLQWCKTKSKSNEITKRLPDVRSSRPEVFCKKGVLRSFAKPAGIHLCQSFFFNRVAGLRPPTLLKNRLWHRCFPVNCAKFLRTPFLHNASGGCLSDVYVIMKPNNFSSSKTFWICKSVTLKTSSRYFKDAFNTCSPRQMFAGILFMKDMINDPEWVILKVYIPK